MRIITRKKKCTRTKPKSYYDLTWGGPRRIRTVAEHIWRRDSSLRWNRKVDMMVDADKAARRAAHDPAWRARFERRLAYYEAELVRDNVVEEGWHDDAYVNDGPTPDWVKTWGNKD